MAHEPSDDCKGIFEKLSEYLDAELEAGTCEQLEEHLADCPPCIEFIESLKQTVGACRTTEPLEAPQPLTPYARERLLAAYLAATSNHNSPE
jgi:anti-sigma factor RsiW